MFLLVLAHPGRPGQRAVKRSCVRVYRDFKELGICKEDAADKARWKRLIRPVEMGMLDG